MNKRIRTSALVVRRLLLGVVITPLVALLWLVACALLVANGAGASLSASEVWTNGLILGVIVALAFSLEPLLDK